MKEAVVSSLAAWENFYVIIGSSAAALTGLQFVVITLIAARPERRSGDSIAAFGTPTVVHFCAALAVAAILSAPWQALWGAGLLLGLSGAAGVTYIVIVVRRMRRQADYRPVLEDWLWHVLFPLIAYLALVVAAPLLSSTRVATLFVVGTVTVLLLFIGIHNAWDTVTYLIIERSQAEHERQDGEAS